MHVIAPLKCCDQKQKSIEKASVDHAVKILFNSWNTVYLSKDEEFLVNLYFMLKTLHITAALF
jgi:hypothetical protein